MTLSEDEQNSIYRIAISLLADDPRMASRLDVEAVKFSLYRRRRLAHYALWIGFAIMLLGARFAEGGLSIGAIACCCGVFVQAWSMIAIVHCDNALTGRGNQFGPGRLR